MNKRQRSLHQKIGGKKYPPQGGIQGDALEAMIMRGLRNHRRELIHIYGVGLLDELSPYKGSRIGKGPDISKEDYSINPIIMDIFNENSSS